MLLLVSTEGHPHGRGEGPADFLVEVRNIHETRRERSPHLVLLFGNQVLDRKAIHGEPLMDTPMSGTPFHEEIDRFLR